MPELQNLSPRLYRLADICNVYCRRRRGWAGRRRRLRGRRSSTSATARSSGRCTRTTTATSAGDAAAAASTAPASPCPSTSGTCSSRPSCSGRRGATFDNYNDRNTFFASARGHSGRRRPGGLRDLRAGASSPSVLPAKGHTLGSSVLVVDIDGRRVAFTGDLLTAGGKLYQLHAMEYNTAPWRACCSRSSRWPAAQAAGRSDACPSHGEPVTDVVGDLDRLSAALVECLELGAGSASQAGSPSSRRPTSSRSQRFVPLSRAPALGRRLDVRQLLRRPQRGRQGAVRRLRPRRRGRTCTPALTTTAWSRCASSSTTSIELRERLRRHHVRPGRADAHPRRPHLRHPLPPAARRHRVLGAGRGGAGAGRPGRVGEHALRLPAADPHRPATRRRGVLRVGGVRVRDPLRTGADGVRLGLAGTIDGRKVAFTGDNVFLTLDGCARSRRP